APVTTYYAPATTAVTTPVTSYYAPRIPGPDSLDKRARIDRAPKRSDRIRAGQDGAPRLLRRTFHETSSFSKNQASCFGPSFWMMLNAGNDRHSTFTSASDSA